MDVIIQLLTQVVTLLTKLLEVVSKLLPSTLGM